VPVHLPRHVPWHRRRGRRRAPRCRRLVGARLAVSCPRGPCPPVALRGRQLTVTRAKLWHLGLRPPSFRRRRGWKRGWACLAPCPRHRRRRRLRHHRDSRSCSSAHVLPVFHMRLLLMVVAARQAVGPSGEAARRTRRRLGTPGRFPAIQAPASAAPSAVASPLQPAHPVSLALSHPSAVRRRRRQRRRFRRLQQFRTTTMPPQQQQQQPLTTTSASARRLMTWTRRRF
jgi:hypothetical protein